MNATARTSDDVSVTVTPSVARALLGLAGFKRDERGRWTRDDGRWTWATDEALRWALVTLAEDDDEQYAAPARSKAQVRCLTGLSTERGSLTAWNMIASGDVVSGSRTARSFALASTAATSTLIRHSRHALRLRKPPSPRLPSVTAR